MAAASRSVSGLSCGGIYSHRQAMLNFRKRVQTLISTALRRRKVGAIRLVGSGPLDYRGEGISTAFSHLALAYLLHRGHRVGGGIGKDEGRKFVKIKCIGCRRTTPPSTTNGRA